MRFVCFHFYRVSLATFHKCSILYGFLFLYGFVHLYVSECVLVCGLHICMDNLAKTNIHFEYFTQFLLFSLETSIRTTIITVMLTASNECSLFSDLFQLVHITISFAMYSGYFTLSSFYERGTFMSFEDFEFKIVYIFSILSVLTTIRNKSINSTNLRSLMTGSALSCEHQTIKVKRNQSPMGKTIV